MEQSRHHPLPLAAIPPGLSQQLPAGLLAPPSPSPPLKPGTTSSCSLKALPGCSCLRTLVLAVSCPRRALPQGSPQLGPPHLCSEAPDCRAFPDSHSEEDTHLSPRPVCPSCPPCVHHLACFPERCRLLPLGCKQDPGLPMGIYTQTCGGHQLSVAQGPVFLHSIPSSGSRSQT